MHGSGEQHGTRAETTLERRVSFCLPLRNHQRADMKNLRGFWKPPADLTPREREVKWVKKKIKERSKNPKGKRTYRPKSDDSFHKSLEWRSLRYQAMKNCDGKCQLCGASKHDGIRLHVDHIKPRSKFPHLALVLDNLQVLCDDCNIGKGAWDDSDWRQHFGSI
jgi:5-methylcytosine-specific restriction endonuclease McrA